MTAPHLTRTRPHGGNNPSPAEIIAARHAAQLTQTAAAALVYTSCRSWQQWEAGDRKMHRAFFQLFNLVKPPTK